MDKASKENWIERFLEDRLSPEEREEFRELLHQNPDWQEELLVRRKEQALLDRLAQRDLIQKFDDWDKEKHRVKWRRFRFIGKILVLTGLAILILYATLPYFVHPSGPSREQQIEPPATSIDSQPPPHTDGLAPSNNGVTAPVRKLSKRALLAQEQMQNYLMGMHNSTVRGENPRLSTRGDTVYRLMEARKYREALRDLNQISDQNNRLLYQGMAEYFLGQYLDASQLFERWQMASQESETGEMFRLLSCMSTDSPPDIACLDLLNRVAGNAQHPYHQWALALKQANQ